jgi:hypothetical protein
MHNVYVWRSDSPNFKWPSTKETLKSRHHPSERYDSGGSAVFQFPHLKDTFRRRFPRPSGVGAAPPPPPRRRRRSPTISDSKITNCYNPAKTSKTFLAVSLCKRSGNPNKNQDVLSSAFFIFGTLDFDLAQGPDVPVAQLPP